MRQSVVLLASALVVSSSQFVLAQVTPSSSTTSVQPASGLLTLAELERRALARNPTLAQAASEVDAARGRAKQAGLLPNPTIGYSGDEISRVPSFVAANTASSSSRRFRSVGSWA